MDAFYTAIQNTFGDFWVLIVSAIPIVELRLAVPLALESGMALWKAVLLSIVGNMIPVVPVVFLGRGILNLLKKIPFVGRIALWIENRTLNKRDTIVKYSMFGLFLLVAIPLPGTGAWTGALLTSLLDIRLKNAFPMILLGVCTACAIVTLLYFGLIHLF